MATDGPTPDDRMTLAITAAWGNGKLIDRLLYGQAVILWRNDQHRKFLAGIDPNRQKRLKRAVDLKQLIGQAVKKGWITTLDRNGVEFIKLIVDPLPIGQLTSEESNKIDEIKTIVEKEKSLPDSKIIEASE